MKIVKLAEDKFGNPCPKSIRKKKYSVFLPQTKTADESFKLLAWWNFKGENFPGEPKPLIGGYLPGFLLKMSFLKEKLLSVMVQSGSADCLKIQAHVGKYLEKNTFSVLTQKISKGKKNAGSKLVNHKTYSPK